MAFVTQKLLRKFFLHVSNLEAGISLISHPWLTSLAISDLSMSFDTILSFLSSTPALRHLKMIRSKLPTLNKFEFYTKVHLNSVDKVIGSGLNDSIAPFCTPIYTSRYMYFSDKVVTTVSNFDAKIGY